LFNGEEKEKEIEGRKFFGGFEDVVGGAVWLRRSAVASEVQRADLNCGACPLCCSKLGRGSVRLPIKQAASSRAALIHSKFHVSNVGRSAPYPTLTVFFLFFVARLLFSRDNVFLRDTIKDNNPP
jgi:hypothetical protein